MRKKTIAPKKSGSKFLMDVTTKSLPQSLKLLNRQNLSKIVSDTETPKNTPGITKEDSNSLSFWGLDFPQALCPKCPQTEHAWRWFRTLLGFGCFLVTDEWQTTSPDPLPSWKPSENHRFLLAKTSKAEPNHRPKPWASTPVAVVEALRLRDQHRVHCTAVNSSSRQWQNITTQHLPFGVPKGDPKGWMNWECLFFKAPFGIPLKCGMLQHSTMKEYNRGKSWHGWSPRQKGWSSRVCPFQWWESESLSSKTMQENHLSMLRKFQHINMSNAIQLPAQWLFGTIYHLTTLWILVKLQEFTSHDTHWYRMIHPKSTNPPSEQGG